MEIAEDLVAALLRLSLPRTNVPHSEKSTQKLQKEKKGAKYQIVNDISCESIAGSTCARCFIGVRKCCSFKSLKKSFDKLCEYSPTLGLRRITISIQGHQNILEI